MITLPVSAPDTDVHDPLGYDLPLPLQLRYYPLGYGLDLATNSAGIIKAADWLWRQFPAASQRAAATLRVIVEDCDARVPPRPSMPRGRNHLVTFIHGPDNFAVCDLGRLYTFVCLTR
ncbi:MAG TPA: hypothetical protein VHC72_12265, partial [Bryobacteraceae bacterium]|nr:hypothetical protein [Bryobacteraceae bacterium]